MIQYSAQLPQRVAAKGVQTPPHRAAEVLAVMEGPAVAQALVPLTHKAAELASAGRGAPGVAQVRQPHPSQMAAAVEQGLWAAQVRGLLLAVVAQVYLHQSLARQAITVAAGAGQITLPVELPVQAGLGAVAQGDLV